MGKQNKRQMLAYLPLVLAATFVVAVLPVLFVWWLRAAGIVSSVWITMAIGAGVSFAMSALGGALWKTRTDSQDVLFGELMLWGWIHRWQSERRLAHATELLGLTDGSPEAVFGGDLSRDERVGLLSQLASSLEARDPYTHGHSRRVARHSANIAKRMGMSSHEVAQVRAAAAMHDVGKVKTPPEVLGKKGKLTDEEFGIIKRHPVDGAVLVRALGDDELTLMVRHHHERLDGTGYPYRLTGDEIPMGARIIAVADTFDAITSTRPYRASRAHKEAIGILKAEAGTQLDPDAVRAFCSCYAGTRPLALWTIAVNVPQRVASWFGGGLGAANAASVANVVATAATTAAVGGVAIASFVKAETPVHRDAQAIAAAHVAALSDEHPHAARLAHANAALARRQSSAPRRHAPARRVNRTPVAPRPHHAVAPVIFSSPKTQKHVPQPTPVSYVVTRQVAPAPASHQGGGTTPPTHTGSSNPPTGSAQGGALDPGPTSVSVPASDPTPTPATDPVPTPVTDPATGNGHDHAHHGNPHPDHGHGGHGQTPGSGNGQTHGNGNGNGQSPGSGQTHGNGNGQPHGNGQAPAPGNSGQDQTPGNGHGNGHGNGNGNPPTPAQDPSPATGPGTGAGNGHSDGHGNGHGHSAV